jgi:histidine ammonia-lyase
MPSNHTAKPAATLTLTPGKVDLAMLRRIQAGGVQLALDPSVLDGMKKAEAAVRHIVENDQVVYGINTGFGKLASTRIGNDHLAELQRNLVLSHSVGTGEPRAAPVVRMILATKAVSLARGHSGVRPALVDALLALFNAGVTPSIPCKGSVGASGDLAPLAHMACVLIGEGEATLADGKKVSGAEAMRSIGLEPFVLGPKEGLALLNGTQVSTALALAGLFGAEDVFAAALMSGALSLEAIQGSIKPFDARIHAARGQPGQMAVAGAVRTLLEGSEIVPSHADCGRVQDPYSVRCIPQVMGACLDNLSHAARVLVIEANAASDNPLVFCDTGEVISGGNFHAEPVAFAAPPQEGGHTAGGARPPPRPAPGGETPRAGPARAWPRPRRPRGGRRAPPPPPPPPPPPLDSLPTSANQEDHVSMATFAARRLGDMVNNTAVVVGIEAMAAAQGIELKRKLKSSPLVEAEFAAIRQKVAFLERDRYLAPDIEAMRQWALKAELPAALLDILPSHS